MPKSLQSHLPRTDRQHVCVNCGRVTASGKLIHGFILGPRCFQLALGNDDGKPHRRRIFRLLATVETQPDVI